MSSDLSDPDIPKMLLEISPEVILNATLGQAFIALLWHYGIRDDIVALRVEPNTLELEIDVFVYDQDGLNIACDAETREPITSTYIVPLSARPIR